jgi:hypothetical protein
VGTAVQNGPSKLDLKNGCRPAAGTAGKSG